MSTAPRPCRGVAPAVLVALAACGVAWNEQPLPAPLSAPPTPPPGGGLRAGFARVDITPPPGVGLSGNGPEGKRAAGYRLRLYARALVLEDARGEKIAIVVADLPHLSPNLHRLTAARIEMSDTSGASTGIGADRLILAATHTHAGPGHHYAERAYNQRASQVPGYDPALVEFLVSRFASAVRQAYGRMRPARIAWRQTAVWGHTRNRSYDAFLRDKPEWTPPVPPPPGLDPARVAVDPTWTMLRVDTAGSGAAARYYPAGALSVFALHGTGNPPANDLLDPDIQGIVDRRVERHIDSLAGRFADSLPRAVHLLANGAEGDVSPDWPAQSRCDVPAFRPAIAPGGPRTAPAPWQFREPPARHLALCLASARAYVEAVGDTLGRRAAALFDSLGAALADTAGVAVAFRTIRLRHSPSLCDFPLLGTSVAAGAEDGPSRVRGWRLFGIFPLGFEEGGHAVRRHPKGCHREKRVLTGAFLLKRSIGEHGLAEVAQLSVVRIGGLVLAAVPAEVTTVAGSAMKRAVKDSLAAGGVAVIGLANGYVQYVTTDAEYGAQHYEGGSTLYGPRSAAVLTGALGRLAAELRRAQGRSPPGAVDSLTAYPGEATAVVPWRRVQPPGERGFLDAPICGGDTVIARWLDARPGALVPADGLVLRIDRDSAGQWRPLAWDDDARVEVRALRPKGKGYLWELRWDRRGIRERVRIALLPRAPARAQSASRQTVECPAVPPAPP